MGRDEPILLGAVVLLTRFFVVCAYFVFVGLDGDGKSIAFLPWRSGVNTSFLTTRFAVLLLFAGVVD